MSGKGRPGGGSVLPGAGPGQLLGSSDSLKVELVAAKVSRPETVSGWNFQKMEPKPTRRVVPAGDVFWGRLSGAPDARLTWLDKTWGECISDEEQDRLDGYGLAVVGVEQ